MWMLMEPWALCLAQCCSPMDHNQRQQYNYLKRNKQELSLFLSCLLVYHQSVLQSSKVLQQGQLSVSDNTIALDGPPPPQTQNEQGGSSKSLPTLT